MIDMVTDQEVKIMSVSLAKPSDARPYRPFGDPIVFTLYRGNVPSTPTTDDTRTPDYSDGYGGTYAKGE